MGEGLSVPYARKWSIGGCEPRHSLWSYPHDSILDFSTGLFELAFPILTTDDSIVIDMGVATIWVAANGNSRGADKASAFLIGRQDETLPVAIVNSPEVAVGLLGELSAPVESCPDDELIQIGFPGIRLEDRVYVGSWQWNVHAEVRGEEFVCRTAHATLAAIRSKEAEHDR
ncbi:hypothetical protein [Mycobacterium sp. DL440]|uniref:hypothetical protein n=1 Tax=Mycobacterium sp. DL440 TaxID=2675523 RepID=UPI0014235E1C|nr:hypothetical protein [Mycobacterium sp. DL440]